MVRRLAAGTPRTSLLDLVRVDAARAQRGGRVDGGVGEVVGGVGLEEDPRDLPGLAEPVGDRVEVAGVVQPGLEEAEPALEHGRRPGEAVPHQVGGRRPRRGRPSRSASA